MEGSSVILHCDVDSNPIPQISWFFGDELLMSETASNASLFLDFLNAEQEGVYTCVGENGYGTMNSSLYLTVRCKSLCISCCIFWFIFVSFWLLSLFAPRPVSILCLLVCLIDPPRKPVVNESLVVMEDSSLALYCSSKGNPVPTLTWLKDGALIGTIKAEELSILELTEINPQADGTYRCLAENEYGRASSSLNITVECELSKILSNFWEQMKLNEC